MSTQSPRDRFTQGLIALALLGMAVSLATLLWLEGRFADALEQDIARTARIFEESGVLGEPGRREGVRFQQLLLPLVRANSRGFIRDIWVTKFLDDGTEHLLVPVTGWFTTPDWRNRVAAWRSYELRMSGGQVVGRLHFDLDRTWLARTALAARGVAALLIVSVGTLLWRLIFTRRRLEATTEALRERQRELIHIERLALAGQLSANVLHDLKKPVLNIRHGLSDLLFALGEFSGVRRALEELQQQTDLFQSILRETNLERFVQARDEDQEFLDINETLRHAAGLVRYERRDVEVFLDFNGGLPPVLGSRHRLVQVFSNLILNAYQAMGGKGRLMLRTAAHPRGMVAEVADTGPGLAPQVRERLFQPFVTTKAPEVGTGLGLMICRMIVEQMGGSIEAANRDGGGAVFRVILPAGGRP
ncbi:MAG: hypothetical protein HUU25_01260 [Candidatus Sumerlaeia bacterium]|nr:hypothetical protein [Candidatus Sumerlaeia bacterium]